MKQPQRPEHDDKTRQRIDAMVEAEARYLAALRNSPQDSPPPRMRGRRSFLAAAAAAAGGGAMLPKLVHAKAPPGAVEHPVPADPTKTQGIPTNDDDGYGSRSYRGFATPRDPRVERMTRNVFDRLGDGPLVA